MAKLAIFKSPELQKKSTGGKIKFWSIVNKGSVSLMGKNIFCYKLLYRLSKFEQKRDLHFNLFLFAF